MRSTAALLVVAVGVLLLWMAATGRLDNLGAAWAAIQGKAAAAPAAAGPTASGGVAINPADLLAWLPRIGFPGVPAPTPIAPAPPATAAA